MKGTLAGGFGSVGKGSRQDVRVHVLNDLYHGGQIRPPQGTPCTCAHDAAHEAMLASAVLHDGLDSSVQYP